MKNSVRVLVLVLLLVVSPVAYVYWQSSRGILVIIQNESDATLSDARIVLHTHGPNFDVGELQAHTTTRTRVHAGGESDAELTFRTPNGGRIRAGIIGYFEGGHCGKVTVTISSELKVNAVEKIDPAICY